MRERSHWRPAAWLPLALVLSGCVVGPDYHRPAVKVDQGFIGAGATALDPRAPAEDIAVFWRGFGDATLSSLVERALQANGDVRIAQGRLREARAELGETRAGLFPEVDTSASAGRALTPAYLLPGASRDQRNGSAYSAGFVASWELDLFGRVRRANESAAAQVDASAAGVHAAQLSVAAEVARNFLELRGLQQRFQVAQQSLDNQSRTVRLIAARLGAGRGSQLDVARANNLYDSTLATLPALQAAIERAAYRLATLTAQSPRGVLALLTPPMPLPSLPVTDLAALPLGTPEQLLRRRPDLAIAERQLASATADIGVATGELFPKVRLTGLLGFASDRASRLGNADSDQYSLGASLSWPLLDFGRVRSRIAGRQAVAGQALANYEQTVAVALEETEGALSQFSRSAQEASFLDSATRNANTGASLSRLRFEAGSVDLLIVLDAERQALVARDSLVRSQVAQATALVAVYRSIGGGWQVVPGE